MIKISKNPTGCIFSIGETDFTTHVTMIIKSINYMISIRGHRRHSKINIVNFKEKIELFSKHGKN